MKRLMLFSSFFACSLLCSSEPYFLNNREHHSKDTNTYMNPAVPSKKASFKRPSPKLIEYVLREMRGISHDDDVDKDTLVANGIFSRENYSFDVDGVLTTGNLNFYFGVDESSEHMSLDSFMRMNRLYGYVRDKGIRDPLWKFGLRDYELSESEECGIILSDPIMPFKVIRLGYPEDFFRGKNYSNESHVLDNRFLDIPHLGEFHYQFVDPDAITQYVDPSGSWDSDFEYNFNGDIGVALERILERGVSHNLVISRVADTKIVNAPLFGPVKVKFRDPAMNIKYYGGEQIWHEDGKSFDVHMYVVNFGTYDAPD